METRLCSQILKHGSDVTMTPCSQSRSHLKCMWRVIYAVHSQTVVRGGGLHTAENRDPQSLYG